MKYILTALMLGCAAAACAQPAPGAGKDILQQTPAELIVTASELERTLALQPDNTDLHVKLGFTYTRLGRADDAQRAFENAVRLDPGKAIAHYMLGLIYEKKGLRDRAVTAWRACLATAAEQPMRDTAFKHLTNLNAR